MNATDKFIVTTTVNKPTEALRRFAAKPDWNLIVVGDQKTPHADYADIDCVYLHPRDQAAKYPQLSEYIGWNRTERRTIGIAEAYNSGAAVVAVVDDDNIPEPHWGEDLLVGKRVVCPVYENSAGVFDPLSVTSKSHLWHRGYPLQLLRTRHDNKLLGEREVECLVQADLWEGEPDIDAICRWIVDYDINARFEKFAPFSCVGFSPFNSQNTFLHRRVLREYMMLVGAYRVHDIWAAYWVEKHFPNSVVYAPPSVFQDRNWHSLESDYELEKDTYHLSLEFIRGKVSGALWDKIEKGLRLYQAALK